MIKPLCRQRSAVLMMTPSVLLVIWFGRVGSKMTALRQMILCLYSNQRQIVRPPPHFQERVLRQ